LLCVPSGSGAGWCRICSPAARREMLPLPATLLRLNQATILYK